MKMVIGMATAGFLGAVTRYGIDRLFLQHFEAAIPWPTLLINLSGSLLLGCLVGALSRSKVPGWFVEVAGTGFLGSFTTFSAFSGQLWQLLDQHTYLIAAVYVILSLVGGWLLATVGLSWGRSESL